MDLAHNILQILNFAFLLTLCAFFLTLCAFLLTVFVLRVLLSSYVYLFILCVFVVLGVYCCSYFRCRTAG